jgi:dTDP-4-amino-4,6-dideoxygalactose transaminase
VFHQYVIRSRQRDALISYLNEHEIGTIIHYPIPPHLSEAYAYLGLGRGSLPIAEQLADEVLSIPMYNGMTPEEQTYVIETMNRFHA